MRSTQFIAKITIWRPGLRCPEDDHLGGGGCSPGPVNFLTGGTEFGAGKTALRSVGRRRGEAAQRNGIGGGFLVQGPNPSRRRLIISRSITENRTVV